MSTISASTTSTTAFKITTDTTGALVFQTGASPTTAMTLGSDQSVTFAGTPTYSGGTANGVAYLNASKVLTTGTALVFDGTNLGLGVTPSAWGAGPAALQMKQASIAAQGTNTYWGSNWYGGGFDKYIIGGTVSASLLVQSGGAFTFYTAGAPASRIADSAISFTQVMTLGTTGVLSLGVTPSAWGSAFKPLQTPSGAIWSDGTAGSFFGLVANAYQDGAGWRYAANGYATNYQSYQSVHSWHVAGSGTAGNAISFTQAMTLNASGYLGVGVTSPATYLHVRSSAPSGASSATSGTTVQLDSNGNNYLTFINTADNGTYAGLTFTDNNTGGFVVFRNYTASGVGAGSDCMIYGAYQDHIFQTGSSNTINGKDEKARLAQDGTFTLQNRLVTNTTATAITVNSGGDVRIYSGSNSYNCDIYCDPPQSGMAATGYIWIPYLMNVSQRTSYDRQWNNEPSITVLNDTTNGSQATFRIHGAPGASGGDFSVNLVVDGTVTGLSDERVKTEIAPIQNALSTVCQLEGKTFKYVNSQLEVQTHTSMANGRKFGFIAQQVKDIIPESVLQFIGEVATPNENGYCQEYGIDSASLVALLTEAIKELNAKVVALENK